MTTGRLPREDARHPLVLFARDHLVESDEGLRVQPAAMMELRQRLAAMRDDALRSAIVALSYFGLRLGEELGEVEAVHQIAALVKSARAERRRSVLGPPSSEERARRFQRMFAPGSGRH